MKLDPLLLGGLTVLASDIVVAQTAAGANTVPIDGTGMLAIAAAGLAFGIWIVRRKKDK